MRPRWDDVWLEVASVIAQRSLCSRAKVGAVIVDDRNRIVASGYNGPPSGFSHREEQCEQWCERGSTEVLKNMAGEVVVRADYGDCPSLHAEANALLAADRSSWQNGTIYVTGHVCSGCAKMIGNSGLSRVVVHDDGVDRSYRNYDETYRGLRALGIGVEVIPPAFTYTGGRRDIYHIAWEILNDEFQPDDDTYKGVSKDIHNAALDAGWVLP